MVDTNVIISAVYNPKGVPALALQKTANAPFKLVLSKIILDEVFNVCNRKFPLNAPVYMEKLALLDYELAHFNTQGQIISVEQLIRDVND
jgi:predicted nucleic acid-binding protein